MKREAPISRVILVDLVVYSWAGLFWLVLCIGFPPLALGCLLLPVWHRRRVRQRAEHAEAERARHLLRYLNSL